MAAQAFVINIAAAAITSTPKTMIMLIPGAARPIAAICEIGVSADAAVDVLVELMESTQATNGTAGTDSNGSAKQLRGFNAGDTTAPGSGVRTIYTSEPTVLTRLKAWRFTGPGPFVLQSPLGREIQSLLSGSTKYKGLALRLTSASNVNTDAYIEWEE